MLLCLIDKPQTPMNLSIKFDPLTKTFHYPDGVTETLDQYNTRNERFDYIQALQNALDLLKVLYQNPGCLNEKEYLKAKEKIEEEFEYWQANIFKEYDDAW